MLFTEAIYVPFLAGVLLLYWAMRGATARKVFLLAASYLFYSAWDWRFLSLILLSTAVDYLAGRKIAAAPAARSRNAWLAVSLVVNLGVLATFKYLGFFVDSAIALLARVGVSVPDPALHIILPVGISFYTFQTLSYTIDIHRGRLQPVRSALDLALFVGFFPQLVAGPIVRAATFLPQLTRARTFADVALRSCLMLLFTGYVKKACVADNLAVLIDPVFADPAAFGMAANALAAIGFSVQIYCDFSGYSDIAIASAGLLGFQLPINFDHPFVSRTPAEFWRRWHISLSTWLRDYLYISLGGNRRGRARTLVNLMITMLLGGLWHGAAFTFMLWGGLHGCALVVHRVVGERMSRRLPGLDWLLTLALVVSCFVVFRAEDVDRAVALLRIAVGLTVGGSGQIAPLAWAIPLAFAAVHAMGATGALRRFAAGLPAWIFAAGYGFGWSLALAFTAYTPVPFLYFQF